MKRKKYDCFNGGVKKSIKADLEIEVNDKVVISMEIKKRRRYWLVI